MTNGHVSPRVEFITKWGRGFQEKDLNILAEGLHKDFRHITYPRSIGHPEKNKEEWLAQLARVIPLWIDSEETTHSVLESPPEKVIVHFTNKTKTSVGVNSTYEAITISRIVADDDGVLKIIQMEEFVDSKTLLETIKAYEAAGPK